MAEQPPRKRLCNTQADRDSPVGTVATLDSQQNEAFQLENESMPALPSMPTEGTNGVDMSAISQPPSSVLQPQDMQPEIPRLPDEGDHLNE